MCIGIKNNNPFNLRKSGNKWLGKIPSDNAFEKFTAPYYGYRAALVLLRTYFTRYRINNIHGIVSRFAPPSENDTANYIKFVCQKTHFGEYQVLTLFQILSSVAPAMALVETGYKLDPSNLQKLVKSLTK